MYSIGVQVGDAAGERLKGIQIELDITENPGENLNSTWKGRQVPAGSETNSRSSEEKGWTRMASDSVAKRDRN